MLGCDIYITTRQLTVVTLNEEWEELLELIWKLHTEGMTNKEISHYLNTNGYKPRRTENFLGNELWGILKKIMIRKQKKHRCHIGNVRICRMFPLKQNLGTEVWI